MTASDKSFLNSEFYNNVLESLEDYAVFTVDKPGDVISWNKGAERVLGFSEEEIVGKTAKVIFTPEDIENRIPEQEFKEAMEKGRGIDERYHKKKDGSLFWGSGLVFPLYNEKQEHIGFTKILRNLSNKKLAEEQVLEARQYAQSIVETSKEPILILNTDLTINAASNAFYKTFSLENKDVQHNNLFKVLEVRINVQPLKEQMERYESFEDFEVRYPSKKNTSECIFLVSSRRILRTNKSSGQHLLRFDDVTMQRNVERAKEDFINIASHELKSPITVIKSFAQMLSMELSGNASERVKTGIDRIIMQSDKLDRLSSLLLDASGFTTYTIQLSKESFAVSELVLEIINEVKQGNTTHRIAINESDEISVFADRFRIGQVLTNLLTNAIKYSPEAESILVSINVNKGTNMVRIGVQDFGIGISPEAQGELFKRFSRTNSSKAKNIEGFGMGLYISYEIIRAHEGEIGVSSSGTGGSTFYFDLPL